MVSEMQQKEMQQKRNYVIWETEHCENLGDKWRTTSSSKISFYTVLGFVGVIYGHSSGAIYI